MGGESINREALQEALGYLVGETQISKAMPKGFISAEEFASDLLGFEECEDAEDENELLAATAAGDQDGTGDLSKLKGIAEASPDAEGH